MGFCSFMLSEWVSERVRVDRSMDGPGLLGVRVVSSTVMDGTSNLASICIRQFIRGVAGLGGRVDYG